MFKAARLAKIKEVLLDRGQVDVSTLSALLNVSDVTIRSDLEQLEKEKFVYRTYGGAVLNEDHLKQQSMQDAITGASLDYDKNKEMVGQIAADMVRDNEWIFLGPGTTCYYVAKALLNRENVNVVTNNLYVAGALAQNPKSNVMVTGGTMVHSEMSLTGDLFSRFLKNIFIAKAFIGVGGVDFDSGFTVSNTLESNVYQKIKKISKELIIVADQTKFGHTSLTSIGPLTTVDAVITNDDIPEDYKSYFFQQGIRIFTSYRIKPSSIKSVEE
ncbi:DeoR/GlpR family DNA-binding transcription regulator [Christensenella timonensis]|uniref:DeoR/GlpR family DNA-binding transcription regulator n=1 Tax=Christensenella timonensis TaxID=1816678 RepID=UPI00082EF53A|nr:DeoR/GlpR family DNA-binding transcription regulator [Christensenella timonensis]